MDVAKRDRCPKCGGDSIVYDGVEKGIDWYVETWRCVVCHMGFEQHFECQFVGQDWGYGEALDPDDPLAKARKLLREIRDAYSHGLDYFSFDAWSARVGELEEEHSIPE